MKDRNGATLQHGDKCVVLTGDDKGKVVWIHKIRTTPHPRLPPILVVDCDASIDHVKNEDAWTFAGWVKGKDLTRIGGAA